ncbi:MAG: UbiA family prenyltransferase, partial [Dehalococcoidia bacterium]|nr:UbiA family prenyltransferase [Dehalococcoidia bacterium]
TCFVCFGLLGVTGAYYVNTLTMSIDAVVAAIPVGALITAILVVNNARDIETDRAAGKRTLAVLLGRRGARAEYVLLVAVSYVSSLWFVAQPYGGVWALAPWLSLPMAIGLSRVVLTETTGPPLNRALAGTAQLVAVFAVLLAIGVLAPGG